MELFRVRRMKILLLVSSLACLVLLLMAAFQENFTAQWRGYQKEYASQLKQKAVTSGGPAIDYPIEVRQVYLEGLDRVDRCVTCHVAIDNPNFADAKQPLKTHPGDLLKHHPSDKFGCTVCHQGQGRATNQHDAHARDEEGPIHHWPEPMLQGKMVYTSCGRCHYENDLYGGQSDLYGQVRPIQHIKQGELTAALPGAEVIARGKKLVVENGCLGCHQYRGRGGALGPDITHVGEKTVHDLDFKHVHGQRTVENWMFTHFKSPSAVVPGTLMPDLDLTDQQAGDLAAYMISLKRKSAPAAYTPLPREVDATPIRGETLFNTYCSACHGNDGAGATVRNAAVAKLMEQYPEMFQPTGNGNQRPDELHSSLQHFPRELITPSLRNADTLAVASDKYLRHIIVHGRKGTSMPAWKREGKLSDDEIELLVGYIRSWEPRSADRSFVSATRGNARYGAAMYRLNCSGCHGHDGRGGEIGISLRSPTFLAIASDRMLSETIIHGRADTAMPAWKQFDNREVSDLLAYIRSWQPLRSERQAVLDLAKSREATDAKDAVSIGLKLYRSRCTVCHGENGEGKIGPSINNQSVLTRVSDEFLHDTIVRGRPGTAMPAWRQLSSRDVADLITLMRSWQTQPDAELEQVRVQGDWEHGQLLYKGMCASCHGYQAEGAIGPQLINPVFLDTVSDATLIDWISFGRQGTQMRPFLRRSEAIKHAIKGDGTLNLPRRELQGIAELSRSQIEDIVSFLRHQRGRQPTDGQRIGLGYAPRGQKLFKQMCSSCHGTEGEGTSGPGIRNPSFLTAVSDGFLRATIVLGREGTEMRSLSHRGSGIAELRADQIDDLIGFLRTTPQTVQQPHRFVVGANHRNGGVLYQGFCAGCHGSDGRGGFAPELNNTEFLQAATDGFLQATIIRGRGGTAMRPFGRGSHGIANLRQSEINDIVAYMRQWSPDRRPLRRTEPFPQVAESDDKQTEK